MAVGERGRGGGGGEEMRERERENKEEINLWRCETTRRSPRDAHTVCYIIPTRYKSTKQNIIFIIVTRQYRAPNAIPSATISPCPRHHHRHGRISVSATRASASRSATSSRRTKLSTVNFTQNTNTQIFETHLKFFTFEDIPICPTDLSRPTRDHSIKAACSELGFEQVINLGV
jgi:hypothetical protein